VSQVDLVPTIALLLGVPIPFSNLGLVITDLFNLSMPVMNSSIDCQFTSARLLVEASRLNAHQVKHYTQEYVIVSDELPQVELVRLDTLLSQADSEYRQIVISKNTFDNDIDKEKESARLKELHSLYADYVIGVRSLCRSVWSKFDLIAMGLGGAVTICGFLLNIAMMMAHSISVKTVYAVTAYVAGVSFIVTAYLCDAFPWFGDQHAHAILIFGCFILVLPFIMIIAVKRHLTFSAPSRLELFALVTYTLHAVSLLSNSFVVYEDQVVSFIMLSILLVQFASVVQASVSETTTRRASRNIRFSWPNVASIVAITAVFATCLRLSAVFRSCREEQIDCELSLFAQPLSAVIADYSQFKLIRFSLSVISIVAVLYAIFRWLRHQGNLNGSAYSVLVMYYLIPFAVIVVCLYWMMDGLLPQNERRIFSSILTALPRLVYVLSASGIVVVTISPLCIYLIPPKTEPDVTANLKSVPFMGADSVVPQIYNHIRFNWRSLLTTPKSSAQKGSSATPIVFGLATVYSSSLLVPFVILCVVIAMLLGDNMAPSVALFLAVLYTVMELHSHWIHLSNHRGKLWCVCFTLRHI